MNNAIVNWDSYGAIAHNYYLYHSSTRGLTWIPWDDNKAMLGGAGITGTMRGGANGRNGLSLTMDQIAVTWPPIRDFADDPVYFSRYRDHLRTSNATAFDAAAVHAMFDRDTASIAPYVVGPNGEQPSATDTSATAFTAAFPALEHHVTARKVLLAAFVP